MAALECDLILARLILARLAAAVFAAESTRVRFCWAELLEAERVSLEALVPWLKTATELVRTRVAASAIAGTLFILALLSIAGRALGALCRPCVDIRFSRRR